MKNKAFTLVELLVVIAVIGLLSSIIIVNLSGTRGKASIARGLQFSQSVHHALGSEAVGIWSFDEGSGATAYDASGYGNNGTLYNFASPHGWTTDTPSNTGYALSFDGVDDYVSLPSMKPQYFTISLWVNFLENYNQKRFAGMVFSGDSNYAWGINANYNNNYKISARISTGASARNWAIEDLNSTNYPPGWHHLVLMADGNTLSYYKNGNFVDSASQTIQNSGTPSGLSIGRWGTYIGSDGYFNGLIDEVRIYEKALETAQIEELYYAGLDNLLAKGLIDEQEYQERIALK